MNCIASRMVVEAKEDLEMVVEAKEDLERRAIDEGTLDKSIERVAQEPGRVEVEILRLWNRAQPVKGDLGGMTEEGLRSILKAAAEEATAKATGRLKTQDAADARRFIVNCIVVIFAGLGLCGTIFGVIWVDNGQEGKTDPVVLGALGSLGFVCVLAGGFAMKDAIKASANKEGFSVEANNAPAAGVMSSA